VKYQWFGSPHPDYTVKVYSTQTLEIKDANDANKKTNYDGTEPSAFKSSTYKGMNPPSSGDGGNTGGGDGGNTGGGDGGNTGGGDGGNTGGDGGNTGGGDGGNTNNNGGGGNNNLGNGD